MKSVAAPRRRARRAQGRYRANCLASTVHLIGMVATPSSVALDRGRWATSRRTASLSARGRVVMIISRAQSPRPCRICSLAVAHE